MKPDDLPLDGKQTLAWPMDPETKTLRNGSRLNKVLLLRLDPEGFDAETKERAAEGVVGYSAICPHTGCDVTNWHPDRQLLECPCHFSMYDPKEAAKVVSGPAPRRLPALPLKIVDSRLVVAKPFTGRPASNKCDQNNEEKRHEDKHPVPRILAASALALVMVAAASAQQPLPPLPKPDTPPPVPPILQSYKPVTADRLKQPEDGDWLMYRRTYDGWGYSPLSQITTENVGRLKPVWTLATGQVEGHQAPPIVNNGVMFVATPGNQVLAIDAKKGDLLWRFKRPIPEDMLLLHPTSRGVGLLGDKVYFAAADAVLVALDAKTGKEVWKAPVEDYTHGYYMSLAPLVADGKVMVGVSGGELGVRGFVAAFDAETGKPLWKTYTVPAPGEPGSETWPKGDQWKTGGGSVWITGNYDPETNLSFWGTGNGGPWMGDQRPGDNLFTSSVLALDTATGKIKGYHQYHPNDSWDWDEVSPPILVDYQHDGKNIKGLVDVARDGYLWMLERTGDKINFIDGKPFVKQNVFQGLDPKTGRPNVDPVRQPATGKKADFCPSLWGGKDWPPVAYSPNRRGYCISRPMRISAARRSANRSPTRRDNVMSGQRRLFHRSGCGSHRRAAGLEPRYRAEGLEPSLCQLTGLGTGTGDGRRGRVRRRNQ